MKLSREPFEKISSGHKIIESRLYDKKRQKINIDDQITFACNNDTSKKIITRVRALYRYSSFEELFSDFSPKYFGGKSKVSLIEEINKFYSKKEQKKCGVIGIRIALVK